MERAEIIINGIVQGVGFRPFIHKLVRYYKLSGYIKNTSSGVELELEGEHPELERFVGDVPEKAPKLALIESVEVEYSNELKHFKDFEIRQSKQEAHMNTLISPDLCICDDCLNEMLDPRDRRYRYPFINCTNCGPRFTIIKDVPYDRAKTSMSDFPMCPDCDREYHDIEDRRYHAQPDACRVCGPHLIFDDGKSVCEDDDEAVEKAREYVKDGKIIAVKGLGGMHLACLPEKAELLRKRKHRDEKPFAVMCRDIECVKKICFLTDDEEAVLTSYHRPIVLLRKKDGQLDCVSENGFVGVMLPYTPLHYLLFGDDIDCLIMTSANLSETPIMFKNDEAREKLSGIADAFLLHNREIQTRCDDSLCWVLDGKEYFARRSRGYVPFPIKADIDRQLLACGAEQKASFALSKEGYIFASQHIGDLKNLETYEHYAQQIEHFEKLFDIRPEAVACDMHPDYMSSEYANSLGIDMLPVQHHHAHMASCMADNNLTGEVTGLIWDGTGLGTDGTIWGGECLVGGYERFERAGSIRPIPLIGGDKATEELDRVAYVLLDRHDNELYEAMLKSNLNCPLSSGMGRLFDGVAAILGIKHIATYEGQGATLIEQNAKPGKPYQIDIKDGIFDWRAMIDEMVRDPSAGRFLETMVEVGVRQCKLAENKRVVLSGGTFQNMYLMSRLPERLKEEGFEVYHHRRVSTNDEGISLGQLCVLQYHLK